MAIKGVGAVGGSQSDYAAGTVRSGARQQDLELQKEKVEGAAQVGGLGKVGAIREGDYSGEDIQQMVDDLNETVDVFNKQLHFRVHEDTNRIIVEVINKDTGDVIREIPPEYVLDLVAKINALFGVFVDEKV